MASHLGRTTQEAQATLTSTEFLKWVWFLDWKATEEFRREDFYLAQIAAEIVRGNVKHPKKIKLKNLLLDFTAKGRTRQTDEQRLQRSKDHWLGITGLRGDKKLRKKQPVPKSKKKRST